MHGVLQAVSVTPYAARVTHGPSLWLPLCIPALVRCGLVLQPVPSVLRLNST